MRVKREAIVWVIILGAVLLFFAFCGRTVIGAQ